MMTQICIALPKCRAQSVELASQLLYDAHHSPHTRHQTCTYPSITLHHKNSCLDLSAIYLIYLVNCMVKAQ